MNINNNALLNTLVKTLTPSIQAKLEKLSIDGKIDLSATSTIKEKSIQTFLNGLFSDLTTGIKSKSDVVNLLTTNKNVLNSKNMVKELNQVIDLVKSNVKSTQQVEKIVDILKNSLIDIKTLDAKILKNSVTNNGVFLESKISQQNNSTIQNLSLLSTQLKSQLTLLQNVLSDVKINLPDNTKSNITQNLQTQQIKLTSPDSSETVGLQKNRSSNLSNLAILLNTIDIKASVKTSVQVDFQTILKTIESLQMNNLNIDKSESLLKNVTEQIDKLDQKLLTHNITNEVTLNLKESVAQLKNNFLLDGFLNLKKMIVQISEQIQGYIKADSTQINKEINNIEQKINTLQESKSTELKISIVKDLILDNVKLVDKINTSNIQELFKNNLGNIKNISEDLKVNLLLLKEIVEKSSSLESQNKELKVIIDKTLSSIDYYQLSSFSSNSNHSFLSFMQDELDDVDIKFNNQKDEFSCVVNLSLKEYGDVKVLLVLNKKNELSINIGVEQDEFKKMIQISLQKLRIQINSVGLLLVNLNVFEINNEKSDELKAYGGDSNLDFGLDIKA